jgi:hypothetical protein
MFYFLKSKAKRNSCDRVTSAFLSRILPSNQGDKGKERTKEQKRQNKQHEILQETNLERE